MMQCNLEPLVTLARTLRQQGRSRAWLAGRIDRHPSLVSHHLQGRRNYRPYLVRYADALGIPVELITPAEVQDA